MPKTENDEKKSVPRRMAELDMKTEEREAKERGDAPLNDEEREAKIQQYEADYEQQFHEAKRADQLKRIDKTIKAKVERHRQAIAQERQKKPADPMADSSKSHDQEHDRGQSGLITERHTGPKGPGNR